MSPPPRIRYPQLLCITHPTACYLAPSNWRLESWGWPLCAEMPRVFLLGKQFPALKSARKLGGTKRAGVLRDPGPLRCCYFNSSFRKEAGILIRIPASRKLAPREQVTPLAGCRSRLVDLIRAFGRVGGAHVYGRADFLELKLIGGGAVLQNVGHVLGVAGVADTLNVCALGGVVALLGGREGLIELAALAFLLFLLGDLGYGWDGSHRQHRQKR